MHHAPDLIEAHRSRSQGLFEMMPQIRSKLVTDRIHVMLVLEAGELPHDFCVFPESHPYPMFSS
jgi:hypothetical protein